MARVKRGFKRRQRHNRVLKMAAGYREREGPRTGTRLSRLSAAGIRVRPCKQNKRNYRARGLPDQRGMPHERHALLRPDAMKVNGMT